MPGSKSGHDDQQGGPSGLGSLVAARGPCSRSCLTPAGGARRHVRDGFTSPVWIGYSDRRAGGAPGIGRLDPVVDGGENESGRVPEGPGVLRRSSGIVRAATHLRVAAGGIGLLLRGRDGLRPRSGRGRRAHQGCFCAGNRQPRRSCGAAHQAGTGAPFGKRLYRGGRTRSAGGVGGAAQAPHQARK